jgi:hypothetical protein
MSSEENNHEAPSELSQLAQLVERLAAIKTDAIAFSDDQVRVLLGGIGRTTLWKLRTKGLLQSSRLYPGGPRRTTLAQLREYLRYLETEGVVGGRRLPPVRARSSTA